jgi:putative endonuclease
MFTVYILKSLKNGKYYIGQTENIGERIKRHNTGGVKSTRYFVPWEIVHLEDYQTRSESRKRENEIKNYKGGIKFKKLLGLWKDN